MPCQNLSLGLSISSTKRKNRQPIGKTKTKQTVGSLLLTMTYSTKRQQRSYHQQHDITDRARQQRQGYMNRTTNSRQPVRPNVINNHRPTDGTMMSTSNVGIRSKVPLVIETQGLNTTKTDNGNQNNISQEMSSLESRSHVNNNILI